MSDLHCRPLLLQTCLPHKVRLWLYRTDFYQNYGGNHDAFSKLVESYVKFVFASTAVVLLHCLQSGLWVDFFFFLPKMCLMNARVSSLTGTMIHSTKHSEDSGDSATDANTGDV